jgi:hypothetical protein
VFTTSCTVRVVVPSGAPYSNQSRKALNALLSMADSSAMQVLNPGSLGAQMRWKMIGNHPPPWSAMASTARWR